LSGVRFPPPPLNKKGLAALAVRPFLYNAGESKLKRAPPVAEERTGCPRQRAQGSLRRNVQEGRDEAGDYPWGIIGHIGIDGGDITPMLRVERHKKIFRDIFGIGITVPRYSRLS